MGSTMMGTQGMGGQQPQQVMISQGMSVNQPMAGNNPGMMTRPMQPRMMMGPNGNLQQQPQQQQQQQLRMGGQQPQYVRMAGGQPMGGQPRMMGSQQGMTPGLRQILQQQPGMMGG